MLTANDLKRPAIKVEPGCQPITIDEFYGMVKGHFNKSRNKTINYFDREAKVIAKARGIDK